jgi:hypothetical protein
MRWPTTSPTSSNHGPNSSPGRAGATTSSLMYVNDNYGDFTAEPSDIVHAALEGARPELVRPIIPEKGCRLLTQMRHSVFYATPLDYLLGCLAWLVFRIEALDSSRPLLHPARVGGRRFLA